MREQAGERILGANRDAVLSRGLRTSASAILLRDLRGAWGRAATRVEFVLWGGSMTYRNTVRSFLLAAACVAVGLSGACASAGNGKLAALTPDQAKQDLVQGKTTESDVKALLGAPSAVSYLQGGDAQWSYVWAHSQAAAADFVPFNFHQTGSERTKTLVILFDARGVLTKYTLSDSHGSYCGGIGC